MIKVHLDGYNILPMLTGKTKDSGRKEIFYFSDDGDLTASPKAPTVGENVLECSLTSFRPAR